MQDIYINLPFVGEALLSSSDGTRGRTYIDGAVNARSVELWVGPCHLILDKPSRLIPRRWLAAMVLLSALSGPLYSLEWREAREAAETRLELVTGTVRSLALTPPIQVCECSTKLDHCGPD